MRPPVANVDTMLLVVSASKPHIDFMLCDKLLIQAEKANIKPVICINKSETSKKFADEIDRQYKAYNVLYVSAYEKTGLDKLQEELRGKCICFAGQSAVGKSSLINVLDEDIHLEIGELSKKTARGKHTTRVVELMYLPKLNAYVLDTPGFSMFEIGELSAPELAAYYREFVKEATKCRFTSCVHDKEPGCAVKQAVEQGKISTERYDRYIKIKKALEDKR